MENRNVLNVDAVDDYVKMLGSGQQPHIKAWLTSTFRRHLLNEHPMIKPVMDERELNSPWISVLDKLVQTVLNKLAPRNSKEELISLKLLAADASHVINVNEYPDWVQTSIANKDNLVYLCIDKLPEDKHRHLVDYLTTLPERQIKTTVEDAVEAVRAWDKRLAKQKLLQAITAGAEILADLGIGDQKFHMSRLTTKEAYVAEGTVMHHCVGGKNYWGKKDITIYSLRKVSEDLVEPIATIEIRKCAITWGKKKTKTGRTIELFKGTLPFTSANVIMQIQAKNNTSPPEEIKTLIMEWCESQGFKTRHALTALGLMTKSYPDIDDEEDGDDEENDAVDDEGDEHEDDYERPHNWRARDEVDDDEYDL